MSDLLQAFLRDRDTPCPNCAYNLRDLMSDACPECGQQITLTVHLVEPKLGGFITGLVALAMSAGFSWLLCAYFLVVGYLPAFVLYLLTTSVAAVLSTAFLIIWIKLRPRYRRWPWLTRTLAVVFCWCVPVINLIVFMLLLD